MGIGREGEGDSLAQVLAEDLSEVLPGLSIVDRELRLAGELRADLVCADDDGRTALVLAVPGTGAAPVLACLDALAFGRRHAALLARHVAAAEPSRAPLRPELEPLVVLAAERFEAEVLERLAALGEERVVLLELCTLRSASGARGYLVRAGAGAQACADPAAALLGFSRDLREEQRELVHSLLGRMGRMDEEVRARATPRSITWTFRDDELARLDSAGGELRGSVPPFAETRLVLDSEDADSFLEAAMARYAGSLGLLDDGGAAGGARSESGPENDREQRGERHARESVLAALDPGGGQILTAEELEAFRD